MAQAMTKKALVEELAALAGISKPQCRRVLESLVTLARREAENRFTIPSLCRISVAKRKARSFRNPRTGTRLWVEEHTAARISLAKKLRDAIAPPASKTVVEAAPAPAGPPPAIAESLDSSLDLFTFACLSCGQEIEASTDMVGVETRCPSCSGPLTVPDRASAAPPPPVLFPCAACRAELEAPRLLVGTLIACPSCGSEITVPPPATGNRTTGVPQDAKEACSRTLRIEIPESFAAPQPPKPAGRKIIIRRST